MVSGNVQAPKLKNMASTTCCTLNDLLTYFSSKSANLKRCVELRSTGQYKGLFSLVRCVGFVLFLRLFTCKRQNVIVRFVKTKYSHVQHSLHQTAMYTGSPAPYSTIKVLCGTQI